MAAEIGHQGKRKAEAESESESESESEENAREECSKSFRKKLTAEELEQDCYDSDDPEMYYGGKRMTRKLIKEYDRQVTESEGFEITLDLDLGVGIGAPIIPQRGKENDSDFVELSHLAIAGYNSDKGTNYEFVENVIVNISFASGMWCYITFLAKDATTNDATTDGALKTFQTVAWSGINGSRRIKFCRLKKEKGEMGPSDSNVDGKAK